MLFGHSFIDISVLQIRPAFREGSKGNQVSNRVDERGGEGREEETYTYRGMMDRSAGLIAASATALATLGDHFQPCIETLTAEEIVEKRNPPLSLWYIFANHFSQIKDKICDLQNVMGQLVDLVNRVN